MAFMGHDETSVQAPTTTAGFFDSSGWSVSMGGGSASATGSAGQKAADVLGVSGGGLSLNTLLIVGLVYLVAKEVL